VIRRDGKSSQLLYENWGGKRRTHQAGETDFEEGGEDECELVAYSALPYSAIKEEPASGLKITDNLIIIFKQSLKNVVIV